MKRTPRSVYRFVVVLWLTLSVMSVVLAGGMWLELANNLAVGRRAFDLESSARRVLELLLECETGERGFVITGDQAFLEPMLAGQIRLRAELDRLVFLAREDPGVLQRVVALDGRIAVILDRFRAVVSARETRGFAAAAAMIGTGETKTMFDKLRTDLEHFRRLPASRGLDAGIAVHAQVLRAGLTSLATGALAVGAGLFAFWLSRVTLRQQDRERELVGAKLQAERSDQEKSLFFANMSHEIRTPMNSILGFSELLEGEPDEPKRRHYLKSIRSSAASLLQLISDILDMSKIEAGVMELRPEPTDPREVCEFIHSVFTEPAVRKHIKLECKVAADLPRSLLLDRIRLRQILLNLVGNALNFTERGHIHVRLNWQKQASSTITLALDVEDTGIGIPPDKLESTFEPFVQAGAEPDKERQGTGLGLAIVKRLTEAMGGSISAASPAGQGAAFHLRFPNVPISARLPAGEPRLADATGDFNELEPALVLVVDDNEENCRLIAGMFADAHHRLEFAGDGLEAVTKARALRPDLILLDLRMPRLDGRQAFAQIRNSPGLELTPVIAVTASALLMHQPDSEPQFDGHLHKPFSKRELFAEIAHFLPRRTQTNPVPQAGAPPAAAASNPAAPGSIPPELAAELRRIVAEDWPKLRDHPAFNETKTFAETLGALAKRRPFPALGEYAQALAHHAELYEVVGLEEQLNQFPARVEQWSSARPT